MRMRTLGIPGRALAIVVTLTMSLSNGASVYAGGPPPVLGGSPVAVSTEVMTGTALELTVHSYVFRGVGCPVPPGFAALSPHETLFIYYCMNTGATDIQIYAIDNPNGISIHSFGSSPVIPTGADSADRRDPDTQQAGPSLIQFTWSDSPGIGLERLHPNEWSVVFLRAYSMFSDVNAAALHLGLGDFGFGFVLGPVSAPALLIGDLNCDNVVDYLDVDAFVLAVCDPSAYYAAYPACDADRADFNGDMQANGMDIQEFVSFLVGGP